MNRSTIAKDEVRAGHKHTMLSAGVRVTTTMPTTVAHRARYLNGHIQAIFRVGLGAESLWLGTSILSRGRHGRGLTAHSSVAG
eukprot:2557954-Pleurochrysis_carterae.AAC.2